MLNYEKYKDEIENYDETSTRSLDCCLCNLRKGNCDDVNDNCDKCLKESLKFLFSEYKEPIKLTHDEFVILKNIETKDGLIERNCNNKLILYKFNPYKSNDRYYYVVLPFAHLFKFIKFEDEKHYNIQEILNNCEVIDDD